MRRTTCPIALLFCFTFSLAVLSNLSQAQTFTALHTFTGADGRLPQAPLTMDRAGNLYGTASEGGLYEFGTAFKLSRRNGSYTYSVLHSFEGVYDGDGAYPSALVLAPDGTLYGSCGDGGQYVQYGTIFRLQPPASICASISCPWTETILYSFQGGIDQGGPGDIVFNAAGDIVGVTGDYGGVSGTVFEFTPAGSAGPTTSSTLFPVTVAPVSFPTAHWLSTMPETCMARRYTVAPGVTALCISSRLRALGGSTTSSILSIERWALIRKESFWIVRAIFSGLPQGAAATTIAGGLFSS